MEHYAIDDLYVFRHVLNRNNAYALSTKWVATV